MEGNVRKVKQMERVALIQLVDMLLRLRHIMLEEGTQGTQGSLGKMAKMGKVVYDPNVKFFSIYSFRWYSRSSGGLTSAGLTLTPGRQRW